MNAIGGQCQACQSRSLGLDVFISLSLSVQTVTKLAPNVSVFNREELFEEFRSHLMFGFLEGLCLFSAVYESQLRRTEDEERERDAAAGDDTISCWVIHKFILSFTHSRILDRSHGTQVFNIRRRGHQAEVCRLQGCGGVHDW